MILEKAKPLGAELRDTSNAVKHYIDLSLSTYLKYKLTGIEGMTMKFLFDRTDETITAKDIMKISGVSKATMSQTLAGLEKKKFIKTKPLKTDHRQKEIVLTSKGIEVNQDFCRAFAGINQQIEKDFSEEDKKGLRQYLIRIKNNVSNKLN
ncbi:MAG: MarR family transcriptional regulator [Bacilli bacterium]|jgi:DNA-binding MarR family transcriptional regulator